ncbi:MAG: chemotaxis protein CheW [Burkholderiales bacterium]
MSVVTATGRVSLREYQLALSERLQSAETHERLPSRLAVQVAGAGWLVDLDAAAEVIAVPAISPVPLAKPWFRGIANVRGNLYSVSDFGAFLGGEMLKLTAESRLLVLHERFRSGAALLVGRSLGLRALEQFTDQAVTEPAPWVRGQYGDSEGRVWKQLDVAALLKEPAFLEVSL